MIKCLVLLSAYNGEKYINEQINSIINQVDIDYLKIVVRDDGSTDSTIKIVKQLINNGNNIELLEGNNIGFASSFMTLIDYAYSVKEEYDYFLLSDQDDYWLNDKIISAIRIVPEFIRNKVFLSCSYSMPVNENLEPLNVKNKKHKIDKMSSVVQNHSPGHTYLFNEELLSCICNTDYSKIYCHDSYIFTVAALLGTIVYDDNHHSLYRQYGKNQLGANYSGFSGWFKERIRRLKRGDFKKYTLQIDYIYNRFEDELDLETKKEILKFLECQTNIFKRMHFVFATKLYRQGHINNTMFKLAYLFGKFRIKS